MGKTRKGLVSAKKLKTVLKEGDSGGGNPSQAALAGRRGKRVALPIGGRGRRGKASKGEEKSGRGQGGEEEKE